MGDGTSLRRDNDAGAADVTPRAEPAAAAALHPRLQAMIRAGAHHGVELDPKEFKQSPSEDDPFGSGACLCGRRTAGMWARAVRIHWRHLLRFQDTGPVVLLFNDGSAGLLTGANPEQKVVYLQGPLCAARHAARRGG